MADAAQSDSASSTTTRQPRWLSSAVRGGLALALVVVAVNLIASLTGTYTRGAWFWIVLAVELLGAVIILLTCARTSLPGSHAKSWLRRVTVVVAAFGVAAFPIAAATWLSLTYLTPEYAEVFSDLGRQQYLAAGLEPVEVEIRVAELRSQYQPHLQAWYVLVGTLMTGLLFGAGLATTAAILPTSQR